MEVPTNHQTERGNPLMFTSNERIIRHKVGLLILAEDMGNVSLPQNMQNTVLLIAREGQHVYVFQLVFRNVVPQLAEIIL